MVCLLLVVNFSLFQKWLVLSHNNRSTTEFFYTFNTKLSEYYLLLLKKNNAFANYLILCLCVHDYQRTLSWNFFLNQTEKRAFLTKKNEVSKHTWRRITRRLVCASARHRHTGDSRCLICRKVWVNTNYAFHEMHAAADRRQSLIRQLRAEWHFAFIYRLAHSPFALDEIII